MAKAKITNEKELQASIQRLEGNFRPDVHMVRTYVKDTDETVDIPHIGYGFKIDKKDYAFYNLLEDGTQDPNKPAYIMSRDVADKRFLKEYNKAHNAAKKLAKAKNITEFGKIAALTDIAYNMGTEWHLKFPSAMKALDEKNYLEFTKELLRGKDKFTKSKYVKDVGINRVTENTLLFGYDHTEAYNSGDLYKEASKEFISSENPVPKELYRSTPLDRFAFSPETEGMGVHTPRGFLYSEREVIPDYSSGERETFLGDTNIGLSNRIDGNEWWDIKKAGDDIELMYKYKQEFEDGGFIGMQDGSLVLDQPTVTTTPTPRPIQVTTSDPNDPNIGLPEGPDPAGFAPYPTTKVPEGYVNPREKFPFEGFRDDGQFTRENYLSGPPTGSSQSSDSQANTQLTTNLQNALIIDRGKHTDASQLQNELNLGVELGSDITLDPNSPYYTGDFHKNLIDSPFFDVSYEVDYNSLTGERKITRQINTVDAEGNPSQFLIGVNKDGTIPTLQQGETAHWTYEEVVNQGKNVIYKDVYGNTSKIIDPAFASKNVRMYQYTDPSGNELLLNKATFLDYKKRGLITEGKLWSTDMDMSTGLIDAERDVVTVGRGEGNYKEVYVDYTEDAAGVVTEIGEAPLVDATVYDMAKGINPEIDELGSGEEKELGWGQRLNNDIKDWWNSEVDVKLIGLKNPDGTPMEGSFTVGDLVQDVAFGTVLGLLTGDEGDALVSAGSQVASSYVNEMVTGMHNAVHQGTLKWSPDQIEHFEAGMHGLVAMGVEALTGGSAEDVAMVGAQTYATIYGAEKLGELMGLQGKAVYGPNLPGGSPAEVIGGGTISALFTVIQGGNLRDATYSFAAGAAWAYMPVLGAFVTAAQYLAGDLLYPEMSNDAGYTNLNFSDMQTTSFSQGDYDPKKSAPEFVEFTELFMEPIHDAAQDLMEEYGITFEGDFQVEFGRTDGLQIAFWDKDITGFLDRGGYDQETGDISSKLDPRRRFEANAEGVARAQEYIIGLLTWGAKNGITKVTEIAAALEKVGRANTIEALQPAVSEYGITADDNLLDTILSVGAKKGGKISLDKGGDVQYNKGNYGLVNEKGKAPPSARADDVSMSLKEGDYVLSQPAVALYGEDTINRMLSRAATQAGTNLKAGGKVPVNVHNGEYIIPKNLTEYIGPNVLETMNNRGLMSVGERPNT